MKKRKITVLIPCHNEEKGLGKVIDDIPFTHLRRIGYETSILVVDNNSSDNTALVASQKGAMVVFEEKKGKGHAIKAGLRAISNDTDYIVMLDGDNTYKPKEISRLIEPLANNFCEVVVGSRLGGKMKRNSLRFRNRVVNWAFTFLVRQCYRANVTDVLSGYFAWKRKVILDLLPHLSSEGFAIEMEMITKMVKLKHSIYSVPITYDLREGHSKIQSFPDGAMILYTFLRNLFWKADRTPSETRKIQSKTHTMNYKSAK